MSNKLEVLRSLLEENYKEGKKIYYSEIRIDFESNITELFKSACGTKGKQLSLIKATYSSIEFQTLFDEINADKIFPKDYLPKLLAHRTTISRFLSGSGTRDDTLDYISVALGYKGHRDPKLQKKINKALEASNKLVESKKVSLKPTIVLENLQITGATIIDEAFVNKVKSGPKISRTDYYVSSYDNNGQWYGITQNYDILRKIYCEDIMLPNGVVQRSIKNQLANLFEEEYYVELKVSGIFHGDGGSGKSTLLRRLAIDFHNEEKFQILWVTDFGEFIADGFEMIRETQVNFLVFIEDWYRLTKDIPNPSKFLKDAREINNVRFIIGDRTIGKEYKQFLNNDLNIHLTTEENPQILAEILNECPGWKTVAKQLFENKAAYNSTLFLLLFIIARVSNNKVEIANRQPERIFEDIIASDFKDIECENRGLAKILQQWACIYTKNKIYISTDTFLEIANRFNDMNESSSRYIWNSDDPLQQKLKIYINNEHHVGKHSNKDFIRFNHDILAEMGLSKLKLLLDKEKRKLLEIITEIGDDHSASLFLSTMLRYDQQIFINREDKIGFINKLIDKKNNHYSYTVDIVLLKPTNVEWEFFAQKNLEAEIYSPIFWKGYFKFSNDINRVQNNIECLLNLAVRNEIHQLINICLSYANKQIAGSFSKDILNDPDWKKNHYQIICSAIRFADDETILDFSNNVLNDLDWKTIHYQIICNAIRYADDKTTLEFANNVLNDLDWKKIPHQIICNAIRLADNETSLDFSKNVLNDLDWGKISHEIICNAIRYADDKTTLEFANNVLNDPDWKKIPHQIICNAIRLADNETSLDFSKNVLNDLDWGKIPHEIICNAIRFADDETTLEFSKNTLKDPNWEKTPYQIISLCLGTAKNKEVAKSVLNKWKTKSWNLIYNALIVFENEVTLPLYVSEVIEEIILDFHKRDYSNNQYVVNYSNLFKISFQTNNQWVEESKSIIKNWSSLRRDLITNVIWGYRMLPQKTTGVCKVILQHWMKEVNQNVNTVDKEKHKGDHVKLALGHPHLKLEAKRAAIEMDIMLQTNYTHIPEYLHPIITQIVEEDVYPDWVI